MAEATVIDTTTTWSIPAGAIATFRQPKRYRWVPKEDITTYELELCLPIVSAPASSYYDIEAAVSGLPEGASRHFEEVA